MTGDRYFIATSINDEHRAHIREFAGRDAGLQVLIDRAGLIVVAASDARVIDLNGQGIIVGALHTPGQRAPLNSLRPDVVATILASRGDHLVRAYWGDYVAMLAPSTSEAIDFVRAPLSALPCFHARSGESLLIASDVDLLGQLGGYRPSLDWDSLLRFVIAPDVREQATCLTGLSDLLGGDRLTWSGDRATISTLWSPWAFAATERQFDDREEAARRLHGSIMSSFGSALSSTEKSVIMLSGGLDSSIVSASVAGLGLDARCLTVSTNAASGDERVFARKTAEHLGLPLDEARFELDAVDLAQSAAAGLPRPVARAFEYEARRQSKCVAHDCGADSVLSGGGGDNIFCSLQSVTPAVDALRATDDRRDFWRVARELSGITGASLWTIAWRSKRRSWQRKRQYPKPVDTLFLAPDAAAVADDMPRHPWLQRPLGIQQGKGAHVAALLGVQTLTGDRDVRDSLALRFPLLAQPIVETCLRIPTWFWYDRGCNRAAARHAFSNALPDDIAWRRSKGTPDGFIVELYDQRRDQIREMLLEGNLARRGLIDRAALAPVLDDRRPVRGTDHGRIMRLVDIEAWTRSLSG